jgi:hypothetical protein
MPSPLTNIQQRVRGGGIGYVLFSMCFVYKTTKAITYYAPAAL